ncbi:MAG: hypothetical protein ACOCWZ_02850 [Spirochaetota bacterium]
MEKAFIPQGKHVFAKQTEVKRKYKVETIVSTDAKEIEELANKNFANGWKLIEVTISGKMHFLFFEKAR